MTRRPIDPPPAEPTYGQSCDGGNCSNPSAGWRRYPDDKPPRWLPVCERDLAVVPADHRVYDHEYDETPLSKAVDHAIPAAIDRAVRRDHSLCGAEPCSDCR